MIKYEIYVIHDKITDGFDMPKFFRNREELIRTIRMIPEDHIMRLSPQDYEAIRIGIYSQPTINLEDTPEKQADEYLAIEPATYTKLQLEEVFRADDNRRDRNDAHDLQQRA